MSRRECEQFLHQEQQQQDKVQRILLTKQNHKIGVIIRKKQTHQDLVRYLHAACFSPVKSTWVKAIQKIIFVRGRDLPQK